MHFASVSDLICSVEERKQQETAADIERGNHFDMNHLID
jgi:hypothetical protein